MPSVSGPSVFGLPSRTAAAYTALFLAAFACYTLLWPNAPIQEGDSPQYLAVARDLADFRLDALRDRTPGYPLLLVITGSSDQPTRLLFFVSLWLHFACIWLLAALLHVIGVPARGLLAFGALLILPPYVEPAGRVMTENLAQFTLVVGFVSLMLWLARRRSALLVVSGLAFGYSGLTRPAYQAIAFVMFLCLLLFASTLPSARMTFRDVMKAGSALIAGSVVLLGAVSCLNYQKLDYFGVIPSLGFHLSTKTMSFVERLPQEYAAVREILVKERDSQLTKRGGTHTGTQTVWAVRSELSAATGLSTPELSNYLLRMNLTLIRRAPLEYLQEVARSMSVYWFPATGVLANLNSTTLRGLWALTHLALVFFFFLQLVVLVGVSALEWSKLIVFRGVRPDRPSLHASDWQVMAYVVAGAIVFYTMVLSCFIDIGEPRQRQSTDALFIVMCVVGTQVWRQTVVRARYSQVN